MNRLFLSTKQPWLTSRCSPAQHRLRLNDVVGRGVAAVDAGHCLDVCQVVAFDQEAEARDWEVPSAADSLVSLLLAHHDGTVHRFDAADNLTWPCSTHLT